jgi:hypothetical protein
VGIWEVNGIGRFLNIRKNVTAPSNNLVSRGRIVSLFPLVIAAQCIVMPL